MLKKKNVLFSTRVSTPPTVFLFFFLLLQFFFIVLQSRWRVVAVFRIPEYRVKSCLIVFNEPNEKGYSTVFFFRSFSFFFFGNNCKRPALKNVHAFVDRPRFMSFSSI